MPHTAALAREDASRSDTRTAAAPNAATPPPAWPLGNANDSGSGTAGPAVGRGRSTTSLSWATDELRPHECGEEEPEIDPGSLSQQERREQGAEDEEPGRAPEPRDGARH